MGILQSFFAIFLPLIFNVVMIAAAYKIFQMSQSMDEIKELLRDIRSNTGKGASAVSASSQAIPQVGPMSMESAEELLRAVAAESYADAPPPVSPSRDA